METKQRRILKKDAVMQKTGMSGITIDRAEEQERFPKRVQTGPNSVGWFEHEVDAWLDALPRGPLPPRPGPVKRHIRGRRQSDQSPAAA